MKTHIDLARFYASIPFLLAAGVLDMVGCAVAGVRRVRR